MNFDGYGLELVFEEEVTDAAEALALLRAGGEAVLDLLFGVVARAEFGGPIGAAGHRPVMVKRRCEVTKNESDGNSWRASTAQFRTELAEYRGTMAVDYCLR